MMVCGEIDELGFLNWLHSRRSQSTRRMGSQPSVAIKGGPPALELHAERVIQREFSARR
jgi:hypothetical protein